MYYDSVCHVVLDAGNDHLTSTAAIPCLINYFITFKFIFLQMPNEEM